MAAELTRCGAQYMFETAFSEEQSVPTNFYLALVSDTNLAADTEVAFSDLTEVATPGASGYARQAVATNGTDFTSSDLGSNDWGVTTSTETFSATGTWKTASAVCMVDSDVGMGAGSGKLLVAWADLSTDRSLVNGDSLQVAMQIKLTN